MDPLRLDVLQERITSDSRAAQALLNAVDELIEKKQSRASTRLQLDTMREQLQDLQICLRCGKFDDRMGGRLLTLFEGWLDQYRRLILGALIDHRKRIAA